MLIYRKGNSALRLLRLSGSPLPLAALIALAPLLLTASLDGVKQKLRQMTSYYPFQPITSLTGVALVFMTNVSYERYWECASRLVSASAQWGAAAAEAIAFDEIGAAPAADSDALVGRRLSQATTLHLFSLLHALALQYVRGDSDMEKLTVDGPIRAEGPPRLPILCGLPEGEYCELARTPHYARIAMVYSRLLCHLNERRARGGLMVEPPVLSVVYAQLSSGLADFKQAAKIDEVPFPFPYAQIIVMLLFCQLLILPVITTALCGGPIISLVLVVVTSVAFVGIHGTATALQDPFVHPPNDLPSAAMQKAFNARLLSAFYAHAGEPNLQVAVAADGDPDPPEAWHHEDGEILRWARWRAQLADDALRTRFSTPALVARIEMGLACGL